MSGGERAESRENERESRKIGKETCNATEKDMDLEKLERIGRSRALLCAMLFHPAAEQSKEQIQSKDGSYKNQVELLQRPSEPVRQGWIRFRISIDTIYRDFCSALLRSICVQCFGL